MTITPVLAVSNKSNLYNSVNFEAHKKHKENKNKFAIPLVTSMLVMTPSAASAAALVRMSNPIEHNVRESRAPKALEIYNIDNIDEIVVSSKTFSKKDGTNYTVRLLDNVANGVIGAPNKKLEIVISSKNIKEPLKLKVNDLVDYKYRICSDDGTKGNDFNIKCINSTVENDKYKNTDTDSNIYDNEMYDYINSLKLVTGTKGDCIGKKVYKNDLRISSDLSLQNVPNGDTWKTTKPKASYGTKLGAQSFDGVNGKYTLTYYDSDKNENNMEVVTVSKPGYPELQVVLNGTNCADFTDYDIPEKQYFGTTLLKGEGEKLVRVADNALANALISVHGEKELFHSAYAIMDSDYKYEISRKGIVYPVEKDDSNDGDTGTILSAGVEL